MQQVGGYLGYTGRDADVLAMAARDPQQTFAEAVMSLAIEITRGAAYGRCTNQYSRSESGLVLDLASHRR